MRFMQCFVMFLLSFCAIEAGAHTGFHAVDGFGSGFAHPFFGADHVAAMLAVGLWSAWLTPDLGRVWRLPVAFMAAMAMGGAVGASGVEWAGAEPGIAASVLMLGLLMLGRVHLSQAMATALVGLFALAHGFAHGAEMIQGAAFAAYAAGFVLATGALHLAGIALGLGLRKLPGLYRLAGAAVGMFGLTLLAQTF